MTTASACALASLVASWSAVGQPAPALEVPTFERQIALALQAAPEDRRASAAVLGYSPGGNLVRLREGPGDLICLADDPRAEAFEAACYHRDLEPYMARGRALRASGIKGKANREARWKAIEAGELAMPRKPRALYVLHGAGFDAATGEILKPYLRWVIFTPFATAESTGLSVAARPNAPWIMFPGTAGAHIMINPPLPK